MPRTSIEKKDDKLKGEHVFYVIAEGEELEAVAVKDVTDWGKPQANSETKTIPEFVNVSKKVQKHTIPYQRDNTQSVPKFGILKGEQFRSFTVNNPHHWGRFPWYVEREVNKNGEFDPDYLLTEKQMIAEIKKLSKIDRIRHLINNSKILDTEELSDPAYGMQPPPGTPNPFKNTILVDARKRGIEDRVNVKSFAMERIEEIRTMLEEAEKKMLR